MKFRMCIVNTLSVVSKSHIIKIYIVEYNLSIEICTYFKQNWWSRIQVTLLHFPSPLPPLPPRTHKNSSRRVYAFHTIPCKHSSHAPHWM